MNVDTGQVLPLDEIYKRKDRDDFEELPEGVTEDQIKALQAPMNRHERRAEIARLRKEAKKP